jgi:hypothetical protein
MRYGSAGDRKPGEKVMSQYLVGLYQPHDDPSVEIKAMVIEKAGEQRRRKDNTRGGCR